MQPGPSPVARLSTWFDEHLTFRMCLVLAGLLGLGMALDLCSADFLLGCGPFWQSPPADTAEVLIALRYFDAEPWRWPLTHISNLAAPAGMSVTNVTLPIIALLGKAAQPILGKEVNFFGAYVLVSMMLQPVAMVWMLWETGVRSRVALVCGAVIALSFPIFLFRIGHLSLIGQYPVTAALALYFTTGNRSGIAPWAGFVGLSLLTMLIMLYLTAMVDGIFAAAVLTDVLRAKRLRTVGVGAFIFLVAGSLLMLWAAEYLSIGGGTFQGNSYGYYSMNLLSPVVPQNSTLFATEGWVLDATGGQYEGMGYLGAGLLLLLCAAVVMLSKRFVSGYGRSELASIAKRNWPLLAMLLGFVIFAVSNEVYVGKYHFRYGLPVSSDLPGNFRSSGRFFWPMAYALAAGVIWLVDRFIPAGKAGLLLLLAAELQFVDTSYLRAGVSAFSRSSAAPTLPAEPWQRLIRAHDALIILPQLYCASKPTAEQIMDMLLDASAHPIPVNTMYNGRSAEDCVASAEAARHTALDDGALHVFFDEEFSWGAIRDLAGAAQLCRKFPGGHVCTGKWPAVEQGGALPGLAMPGGSGYVLGQTVSLADTDAADYRGWGWWRPDGNGAWTVDSRSDLVLDLATPPSTDRLEFRFRGHVSLLGTTARRLALSLGGTKLREWTITEADDHDYAVVVPAALVESKRSLRFDLTMDEGKSERDLHLHSDNRRLGFYMERFSLADSDR